MRYIGRRWNDETNTSAEGGVALLDASVHYPHGPWRYALNANNLFDRDYTASRAFGDYYPGSERNLLATVKYRFRRPTAKAQMPLSKPRGGVAGIQAQPLPENDRPGQPAMRFQGVAGDFAGADVAQFFVQGRSAFFGRGVEHEQAAPMLARQGFGGAHQRRGHAAAAMVGARH